MLNAPQTINAITSPPAESSSLNAEPPDAWGIRVIATDTIPSGATLPTTWVKSVPLGWINEKTPKYRISFSTREVTLQKCPYSTDGTSRNLHYLYRDRLSVTIDVMDATKNNYEIASRTFVGPEPERCPESTEFYDDEKIRRVLGEWPAIAPFQTWLATTMQGKLVTAHPLQPKLKLTAHKMPIIDVAYSADAKLMVTTSQDQLVYIWNAASGRVSRSLKTGHTGKVTVARFSPDAKFLATGSADKSLRMWTLSNGKQVFTTDQLAAPIDEIVFSPDGTLLATISNKRIVSLLDAATGELKFKLYAHTGPMLLIKFSDDGQQLIGISSDNYRFTWSVASGKELSKVAVKVKGASNVIALSPNGHWFVTVGSLNRFLPTIVNVESGEVIRQLIGHKDQVVSVQFSADGKYILTGSKDGTARLWDAATGEDLLQLPYHVGGVTDAAFSPDGKFIVTISPEIIGRVWQLPKEFVPVPPKK
ncbi:MAG: WD40 repeat domain-containing protein [Anaerolineae bacterium]|nr:WD40 repeat domain-containing protein [Anaerolineae bacterium]